jgi:hypothetical protein
MSPKAKGTRGQSLGPGPGRGKREKTGGSRTEPPVLDGNKTLAEVGIDSTSAAEPKSWRDYPARLPLAPSSLRSPCPWSPSSSLGFCRPCRLWSPSTSPVFARPERPTGHVLYQALDPRPVARRQVHRLIDAEAAMRPRTHVLDHLQQRAVPWRQRRPRRDVATRLAIVATWPETVIRRFSLSP